MNRSLLAMVTNLIQKWLSYSNRKILVVISELEALFDSRSDIEMTADLEDIDSDITSITQPLEPLDISTDSIEIAEPTTPPIPPHVKPLSQLALAKHLSCRDKVVEKQRKLGKENFAAWSRERDPDGVAWTWEGTGGRGHPLRFTPIERLSIVEAINRI